METNESFVVIIELPQVIALDETKINKLYKSHFCPSFVEEQAPLNKNYFGS